MNLPIAEAQKEFDELSRVLEELKRYEYEVKAVQWRERLEHQKESVGNENIMTRAEIMNTGYKVMLDAYQHITGVKITEEDKKNFDKMRKVLEDLTHQEASVLGQKRGDIVKQLTDDAMDQLEKNGEVFVRDSIDIHHAIAKYVKEDGKYYKIEYNAGYGGQGVSLNDELSTQYGISKIPINSSDISDVEDVIRRGIEIKCGLSSKPHELLGKPILEESKLVSSQSINNCTTRSTREMLRDHLSTEHMRNLYDMTINVPYNDVKAVIENRRNILAKEFGIDIVEKKHSLSVDNNNARFQNTLREAFNKELGLPLDNAIADIERVTLDIVSQLQSFKNHPDDIDFVLAKSAKWLIDAEKVNVKSGKISLERVNHDVLQHDLELINSYNEGHTAEARNLILHSVESFISKAIINAVNETNKWSFGRSPKVNDDMQTEKVVAEIVESFVSKDAFITEVKMKSVIESLTYVLGDMLNPELPNVRGSGKNFSASEFLMRNKDNIISETRQLLLNRSDVDQGIRDYNSKMRGRYMSEFVSQSKVQDVVRQLSEFAHPSAPKSTEELMDDMRARKIEEAQPKKNVIDKDVQEFFSNNRDVQGVIERLMSDVIGGKELDIEHAPKAALDFAIAYLISPLIQDPGHKDEVIQYCGNGDTKSSFVNQMQSLVLADIDQDEETRIKAGISLFKGLSKMYDPEANVEYLDKITDIKKLEALSSNDAFGVYRKDPSAMKYLSDIENANHIRELVDGFKKNDSFDSLEEYAKSSGVEAKIKASEIGIKLHNIKINDRQHKERYLERQQFRFDM